MKSADRPNARRAALALALLLAGCGGGSDEPIRIGLAGPLDQANGRSMKMAAEMAVKEINDAGGIDGRMLVLEERDDKADPKVAINVARHLRDSSEVVAVIGHVNSTATLEAAKVYNDESGSHEKPPVPQISPASSSPLVSEAGPWTYRVCPSDLLHGPRVANLAYSRLGSRRAAVLYTNDAYGRGVAETFATAFQQAGGTVVSRDPYLKATVEADGAVDAFLARAIRRGMDALMIAGQADVGVRIVRDARRLGFTGPVVGADGMTGAKDAGAAAEGIYVSSAFLPDRSAPKAREFVQAYSKQYKELPDHRGAMTYDAIKLVAQAIGEVGADREALRGYLDRVGRQGGVPAFEGVSGTIAFDEKGDVPGKEVVVGVVRGGRLVSVQQ